MNKCGIASRAGLRARGDALIRLGALLLAAILTTMVVAIAFSLRVDLKPLSPDRSYEIQGLLWDEYRQPAFLARNTRGIRIPRGSDDVEVESILRRSLQALDLALPTGSRVQSPDDWLHSVRVTVTTAGFPCRAMGATCVAYFFVKDEKPQVFSRVIHRAYGGLLRHAPNREVPPLIPLFPIWIPLMADVAFYFAVFELARRIWRGALHTRARSRARRGVCARCKYPILNMHPVCPECGAVIPARRADRQ